MVRSDQPRLPKAMRQARRAIALCIQELVVGAPAQHEAQVKGQQQTQPEGSGEALIEDMHLCWLFGASVQEIGSLR